MKNQEKFVVKETCHKDALGNEIVIGKKYGWSHNKNGFSSVIIGEAISLSKNGVMIKVISSKRALYDNDPKRNETKEKINIRGINLFPIL